MLGHQGVETRIQHFNRCASCRQALDLLSVDEEQRRVRGHAKLARQLEVRRGGGVCGAIVDTTQTVISDQSVRSGDAGDG